MLTFYFILYFYIFIFLIFYIILTKLPEFIEAFFFHGSYKLRMYLMDFEGFFFVITIKTLMYIMNSTWIIRNSDGS